MKPIAKGIILILVGIVLYIIPFILMPPPWIGVAIILSGIVPIFFGVGTLALWQKDLEERKKKDEETKYLGRKKRK